MELFYLKAIGLPVCPSKLHVYYIYIIVYIIIPFRTHTYTHTYTHTHQSTNQPTNQHHLNQRWSTSSIHILPKNPFVYPKSPGLGPRSIPISFRMGPWNPQQSWGLITIRFLRFFPQGATPDFSEGALPKRPPTQVVGCGLSPFPGFQSRGFALSSLETTLKKWVETRKITKGLATWQSLGLILSMVTVGAYGGPRVTTRIVFYHF